MNASDVVLRPMRWWDVEAVQALDADLFGPTAWPAATFWSELAAGPSRWYMVAELADADGDADGAVLAGYAGLLVSAGEADVQTIGVAPSAQGRGVGTRLLRALTERAARAGATSLLLEVRADNAPAIGLYTREGFERVAVRRRYYQPGDVDALVLRLRPLPVPVPTASSSRGEP